MAPLAVPLLKSAAEKNPQNPEYQYHLGMALAKAGDTRPRPGRRSRRR